MEEKGEGRAEKGPGLPQIFWPRTAPGGHFSFNQAEYSLFRPSERGAQHCDRRAYVCFSDRVSQKPYYQTLFKCSVQVACGRDLVLL